METGWAGGAKKEDPSQVAKQECSHGTHVEMHLVLKIIVMLFTNMTFKQEIYITCINAVPTQLLYNFKLQLGNMTNF